MAAVGTINIGTGAVNTTYSVTGKTPATAPWKVVILFWSGRSETTDASGEQDIKRGMGVALSTSSRWAVTTQIDHGVGTMATDGYQVSDACVHLLDTAGAVVAAADFSSFNSDGFTLIVDDVFPTALEVSYVLLDAGEAPNAACGFFQATASTGDSDYTGLTSFTPEFALFAGVQKAAVPPGAPADEKLTIGAATASAQYVLASNSTDNVATSDTLSYCFSGEMHAVTGTSVSVFHRMSLTSFLSTGFRLNRLENTFQMQIAYLALAGGLYTLGDFLSATDTNAFTEAHGMASTPKAIMFFSANRAASTQDTPTTHSEWSVGASDGTNNTCQYTRDKNGVTPSDCFSAVEHDECYFNADNSATMVIEGSGHVTSFDGTNINLIMTDADPSQSFVWYAAFGNAAGGGVNSVAPLFMQLKRNRER